MGVGAGLLSRPGAGCRCLVVLADRLRGRCCRRSQRHGHVAQCRNPPRSPAVAAAPAPRSAPSAGARRSFAQATGPEWSGESGSSGHPMMPADAIRAAAADFQNCLQGLYPAAAKRGIPKQAFDTLYPRHDARSEDHGSGRRAAGVHASASGTISIGWSSEERIQRGREVLAENRATFDAMEKPYGVDRYVIAAIWGIESKYSTMMGERSVVRSTATLACVGRRQDYFRNEFLAAIETPVSRRRAARSDEGLLGGCVRPDPVHADGLQDHTPSMPMATVIAT